MNHNVRFPGTNRRGLKALLIPGSAVSSWFMVWVIHVDDMGICCAVQAQQHHAIVPVPRPNDVHAPPFRDHAFLPALQAPILISSTTTVARASSRTLGFVQFRETEGRPPCLVSRAGRARGDANNTPQPDNMSHFTIDRLGSIKLPDGGPQPPSREPNTTRPHKR
jgi:hypothetical protein